MRRHILIAAALMITTSAHAHNGVKDPEVMARMMAMEKIGAAFKTLVSMAKQDIPLHQAKARMARDTIVMQSGKINGLFESPATDPKSEALPTIWEDWADFSAKSGDLTKAGLALDFKDRAALVDTLAGVGLACKACHKNYRLKKD
ncbi:c-type cytochrome [Shimia sagamensis]|uniref:Cytochrome c556 n=1 Tax=Shimia sagamensis TaxID=1566352 RepID=A0ABY1P748_9RHOB|nr:cytochrome c [Shimia sagamensis]SMP27613.1 Cytochrome c556 [Shimia sagamensis]